MLRVGTVAVGQGRREDEDAVGFRRRVAAPRARPSALIEARLTMEAAFHASALTFSVQATLRRLVILVEAAHYTRVPTQQLLGPCWKPFDDIAAQRSDVVDLLFDPRARELLVDGEPILPRRIRTRRVPQRRVEHDHRPPWTFDRHGRRRNGVGGRHTLRLLRCGNDRRMNPFCTCRIAVGDTVASTIDSISGTSRKRTKNGSNRIIRRNTPS